MHQAAEQRAACRLREPERSTDLAHLGPSSDWWRRASAAQAVTTPRVWSDGTLGSEFVQMCRPVTESRRVITVIIDGDVADAVCGWGHAAATPSAMASTLMPESWMANEVSLDLGAVLSAALARRLTNLEQRPSLSTNVDDADEARRTLGVTWSQLESITGISEQTFYDWKRNNRTARPSTLRKLKRLMALVRAVTRERGADAAADWFQAGAPSPVELMIGGQMEAVEAQVGMMLPSAVAPGSSGTEVIGSEEQHAPLAGRPPARRPRASARPHRSSRVPPRD